MQYGAHLGVKDILDLDALLIKQGSCSLSAMMENLDNLAVSHQIVKAL